MYTIKYLKQNIWRTFISITRLSLGNPAEFHGNTLVEVCDLFDLQALAVLVFIKYCCGTPQISVTLNTLLILFYCQ